MASKRVLIVDDEEDLTWIMAKHLSKDKDRYDLLTVNNGREALDILSQMPVDLVVSDIRMPEISGLDLLLKIREYYPQTKVIIMTAYGSSEVQSEANERGCFKYIEKPFEIQELRKLILDGVEDRKGFEGRVSDFQLSDLIQMNCLGRLTNALHVSKDREQGVVYFEDGNITHCRVGDLEGEEALYKVLSWEGGTFSVERSVKAPKETIIKGWQGLLMEGLRRADEQRAAQEKKASNAHNVIKTLQKLSRMKGIIFSAVIGLDGHPVAVVMQDEYKGHYKMGEITDDLIHFVDVGQKTGALLHLSQPRELIMEFKNGRLALTQIPKRTEFLVVLANPSVNYAVLRMEIKKISEALQKIVPG